MAKQEVEVTDPSKELAALGQQLKDHSVDGTIPTALASALSVKVDDPVLLDVMGVIQRRIINLQNLADSIADTDLDYDLRQSVVQACKAFGRLLNPQHANQPWQNFRHQCLTDAHLSAFKWFSQTARRYQPLKVIPESERTDALHRLGEVIKQTEQDQELRPWERAPLLDGLRRIEFVLEHLVFFGHDAAIVDLIVAHHKAVAVHDAMSAQDSSRATGNSSTLEALKNYAFVATLLLLPAQAATAYSRYQDWTQMALHWLIEDHRQTPRLLPAPSAIIREDEDREVLPSRQPNR